MPSCSSLKEKLTTIGWKRMTKRNPHAKALSNPLFKPQTIPTKKYDPASDPNNSDFMADCRWCYGMGNSYDDLGNEVICVNCEGTGEMEVWR